MSQRTSAERRSKNKYSDKLMSRKQVGSSDYDTSTKTKSALKKKTPNKPALKKKAPTGDAPNPYQHAWWWSIQNVEDCPIRQNKPL